jgi:hypothetical protein
LNQVNTYPKPEIVKKALTDQKDMASRYKPKTFLKLLRGLVKNTNVKIPP